MSGCIFGRHCGMCVYALCLLPITLPCLPAHQRGISKYAFFTKSYFTLPCIPTHQRGICEYALFTIPYFTLYSCPAPRHQFVCHLCVIYYFKLNAWSPFWHKGVCPIITPYYFNPYAWPSVWNFHTLLLMTQSAMPVPQETLSITASPVRSTASPVRSTSNFSQARREAISAVVDTDLQVIVWDQTLYIWCWRARHAVRRSYTKVRGQQELLCGCWCLASSADDIRTWKILTSSADDIWR